MSRVRPYTVHVRTCTYKPYCTYTVQETPNSVRTTIDSSYTIYCNILSLYTSTGMICGVPIRYMALSYKLVRRSILDVVHLQARALESGGRRTRKRPLILSPSPTYRIISDSSIVLPTLPCPWYLVRVLYIHVRTNRTVRTSYKDLIPCTGEPCSLST